MPLFPNQFASAACRWSLGYVRFHSRWACVRAFEIQFGSGRCATISAWMSQNPDSKSFLFSTGLGWICGRANGSYMPNCPASEARNRAILGSRPPRAFSLLISAEIHSNSCSCIFGGGANHAIVILRIRLHRISGLFRLSW